VREALAYARIQTTRYPAVHRLTAFERYATDLPHSAAAADRHLALPLSAHTTLEQVERVSSAVLEAAAGRA
jgi:dTDP-4-amino-4,6-dideoxygalactose transaminase